MSSPLLRAASAAALVATALALSGGSVGATPPLAPAPLAGFIDEVTIPNLYHPTAIAQAPDGRVFIATKSGWIRTAPSLTASSTVASADLSTAVEDYVDRGLLGIAVDPAWPTRPYVYVSYTYDAPLGGTAPVWNDTCPDPPGGMTDGCVVSGRLSRLTMNTTTGKWTGAEKVLVSGWCMQFPGHAIDTVRFGPEGALYMSAGDGGSFSFADYGQTGYPQPNPCNDPPGGVGTVLSLPTSEGGSLRSQSLSDRSHPTVLSGSVIRVDPDTGAPWPTNPLARDPDVNAGRIVAMGLRNPYRFTFDPHNGDLVIGDVGASITEELDRAPTSSATVKNFGWPCREGDASLVPFDSATLCQNLEATPGWYVSPFYTYTHKKPLNGNDTCDTSGGSSVSGVAFAPDTGRYPVIYNGALFFADYSRSCIWVMLRGSNGQLDPSTTRTFMSGASAPVDLFFGLDTQLYYVDITSGIHRLTFTGVDPVAAVTASARYGPLPLTVSFDARGSVDPTGDTLHYSWDLDGDGVFGDSTGSHPSFTYTTRGKLTVSVRATNTSGHSGTAHVDVIPGDEPPVAQIAGPSAGLTWAVGDRIAFSGTGSSFIDGPLPPSAFHWDVLLHHCVEMVSGPPGCHIHYLQSFDGTTSGWFDAPDHDYPSYLTVALTVTDSLGAATTTAVDLQPRTTTFSLRSDPPGLGLVLGDSVVTTPYDGTVIVGTFRTIGAPTPIPIGTGSFVFSAWSNGRPPNQGVTVTGPTVLTATYANRGVALIDMADASVVEGTGGSVTAAVVLTLSAASTLPVTVTVNLNPGTAGPADYYSSAPRLVTFNPGVRKVTVNYGIKTDTTYEGNETFGLSLSAATNAFVRRGAATVTIVDDDPLPSLVIAPVSIAKPIGKTVFAIVKITLDRKSVLPATLVVHTADGTATSTMYVPRSGVTITIAPGSTSASFSVQIRAATVYTGDRTFFVVAQPVSGLAGLVATGTVTITESLPPPTSPG